MTLTFGIFVALASALSVHAATYTVNATACETQSATGANPAEVAVPRSTACAFGVGSARARAGVSGLGASAEDEHYCCGTATGAASSAEVLTDFMITGPPGPVTISLNFALSFNLGGPITDDFHERFVRIDVTTVAAWNGTYRERVNGSVAPPAGIVTSGVLAPPGPCPATCILTTTQFEVSANTNVPLRIRLSVSSGGGTGNNSGFVDAYSTLYFPLNGPVFNLPPGYTASIAGLNVANNRVVQPVVPLQVTPPVVSFGNVNVGSSSTQVVTVSNPNNTAVTVNSAALDPAGSPYFSLTPAVAGVSIPALGTLDLTPRFTPGVAGPASGTLRIDSTAGQSQVALSGAGVTVQVPPSQQIVNILSFFDSSVRAGTLTGIGSHGVAAVRLAALRILLGAAHLLIHGGLTANACTVLGIALNQTDGNPQPPDHVSGPAAPQLATRIQALRISLGCQ